MPMNNAYLSAVASNNPVTHIGLVDEGGTELSGGGYARKAVNWTDTNGQSRITANQTFDIPAGGQVAGWRGFNAATGGTGYGGHILSTENYTNAGTYELNAANTGINHIVA